MKNSYVVCLAGSREPIEWHPGDPSPTANCAYYLRILSEFDRLCGQKGLTVYLTWNVSSLPSIGPDVIAIVVGDEFYRFPKYAHRVRAVFKTMGTRPQCVWKPVFDPRWLIRVAQLARARLPFLLVYWRARLLRNRANIWDIPLGPYNQPDFPIIPIEERRIDIFFAGSLKQAGEFWPYARKPKEASRKAMFEVLSAYRTHHRERTVELRVVADFATSMSSGNEDYNRALQQTKICMVPQGTHLETFRWYEAMRYGCALICEPLPKRRYYDGAPTITVRNWRELPAILDRLLSNSEELRRMHREALAWWDLRCSERAVASFLWECLSSIERCEGGCRAHR